MVQETLDTAVAIAGRYGLDPKRFRAELRKSISWYRYPQVWTVAFHSKEWGDMIAIAESMTHGRGRIEATSKGRRLVEAPEAPTQTSELPGFQKEAATPIAEFTVTALKAAGFVGWRPFEAIRTSAIPSNGGVYVVVFTEAAYPRFATRSCGGWFKNRDPSVSADALAANWVEGAEVVYIGKADRLKRRLREFADFGAGKPVGHWGGRLIWHLPNVGDLRVAWMETPARIPREVEAGLIAQFRQVYGKPPFANDPNRLGL